MMSNKRHIKTVGTRLISILCVLLCFCLLPHSAEAKKRRKRLKGYRVLASLDPERAQQLLSKIPPRNPLEDEAWLKILGERKAESYTIVEGDTLWGVSKKVIGDPFLWRKLWQENPYLTNPHELKSGDTLTYYAEPTKRELASDSIPIIKLHPDKEMNAKFVDAEIKNKWRPLYFVLNEKGGDLLGELTGGYTIKENFQELDPVYLKIDKKGTKVGDRFGIAHVEKELTDKTQINQPVLGTLVRLVGEVTVSALGQKLDTGKIDSSFSRIYRGDKLIPIQRVVERRALTLPPGDLQTRIVMGDEPERSFFAQGQLVVLNKGTTDGMKEGYSFRAYREEDPLTNSLKTVEPDYFGEVQVVYSGALSSIGFVVRDSEPLKVGDTLVPRQSFEDPPPRPHKPKQMIEIN
jgi:hypothetical protein